jgi:hypothetical protein
MIDDATARAIDAWRTTDPDLENCVSCGEIDSHDPDCPVADLEPDYEQIHHDRTHRH